MKLGDYWISEEKICNNFSFVSLSLFLLFVYVKEMWRREVTIQKILKIKVERSS